jgi:FkbM family methyltransferase
MHPLLFANKVYNKLKRGNLKLSFSQCGEDLIIMFLVSSLKLKQVQYFDIGTNHPQNMNNTYLLYLNNFRGICIEPDESFHKKIKKYRPNDVLIKAGISIENKTNADFFLMDDPLLNTFSQEEAENMVKNHNRKITKKITVPLISINDIFNQYYLKGSHVIVSIDAEGLDVAILNSLDFSLYRPAIICVETVAYAETLSQKKDTRINDLLGGHNYSLYADTHINGIFIDNNLVNKPA